MRTTTAVATTKDSAICRLLSPALDRLEPAFGSGVGICRDADVTGTVAMLSTLRTAVESYLGTNICFASLSLDVVNGEKKKTVQNALQTLHLRQVLPTVQSAKLMVMAHKPKDVPAFDQEPLLVLAIDYSSHWFNVGLYTIGEAGVVDPVEETVDGPTIDKDNQLDALRDKLLHLIANPPSDINLPKQIDRLVVYGYHSKSDALHRLLAEALGLELLRNAHVCNSVFDGVGYMARGMHGIMDTVDFEMNVKSAFGCQWRSKLYRNDDGEL
jgi:hypothetical protein